MFVFLLVVHCVLSSGIIKETMNEWTFDRAHYDFLLTFHRNHGPISYRFWDRRRFQSKIAKFSHPLYFAPPLKGFPLELGTGAGGQKTRMLGLPGDQRRLTISLAVSINAQTWQSDRRMDRHTYIHTYIHVFIRACQNASQHIWQSSVVIKSKVAMTRLANKTNSKQYIKWWELINVFVKFSD